MYKFRLIIVAIYLVPSIDLKNRRAAWQVAVTVASVCSLPMHRDFKVQVQAPVEIPSWRVRITFRWVFELQEPQ